MCVGLTEENRRTLLLVSKILQNVSTGVEFQKEEYMLPFNPFLKEKFEVMKEFYNKAAVQCILSQFSEFVTLF
jgi:TATA-binding protein-associated factor Taf7